MSVTPTVFVAGDLPLYEAALAMSEDPDGLPLGWSLTPLEEAPPADEDAFLLVFRAVEAASRVAVVWSARASHSPWVMLVLRTADWLDREIALLCSDETPRPLCRAPVVEVWLPAAKPPSPSTELGAMPARSTWGGTPLDQSERGPDERWDPVRSGQVVAGRYPIIRHVASGGHGRVFLAIDQVAGSQVAIKWLSDRSDAARRAMRREWAALRGFDLPGVVEIVDDGTWLDNPFLVTRWIAGDPFPGKGVDRSWAALRGPLASLLETLGILHSLGLVHRDLKPSNVLVGASGQSKILDFGLADDARARPSNGVEGTPLYISPEQLRGDRVDGRADLYSVGLMMFEALCGESPHPAPGTFHARLGQQAPSVLDRNPRVPRRVAEVIARLLEREPHRRYRTAREVTEALGLATDDRIVEVLDQWYGSANEPDQASMAGLPADRLQAFFWGPDRLLHLREDAAEVLRQRTGGVRSRVEQELAAWKRLGLVALEDGRFRIKRAEIRRLRAGLRVAPVEPTTPTLSPRSMFGQTVLQGNPSELAEHALDRAATAMRSGHLQDASAALRSVLPALRGSQCTKERSAVLEELGLVAIDDGSEGALDAALYELIRSTDRMDLEPVEQLVRVARSIARGQADFALMQLADLAPTRSGRLELWWYRLQVRAAMRLEWRRREPLVRHAIEWSEEQPDREAFTAGFGWLGHLLYHQEKYREAAAAFHKAADSGLPMATRLRARLDEAAALLEIDPKAALSVATRCLGPAKTARHVVYESHAEWLIRAARYRSGEALEVDHELVEAAQYVGIGLSAGSIWLNEAAVAWRAGRIGLARDLAKRAADAFGRGSNHLAQHLARCLAVFLGERPDDVELVVLIGRAASCGVPSLAAQALALLSLSEALPNIDDMVRKFAGEAIHCKPGRRMDVLSLAESVGPRYSTAALDLFPDSGLEKVKVNGEGLEQIWIGAGQFKLPNGITAGALVALPNESVAAGAGLGKTVEEHQLFFQPPSAEGEALGLLPPSEFLIERQADAVTFEHFKGVVSRGFPAALGSCLHIHVQSQRYRGIQAVEDGDSVVLRVYDLYHYTNKGNPDDKSHRGMAAFVKVEDGDDNELQTVQHWVIHSIAEFTNIRCALNTTGEITTLDEFLQAVQSHPDYTDENVMHAIDICTHRIGFDAS